MAVGWRANYLRYKSYFLDVVGHYQKRKDLKTFMELFLSLATVAIFGIFAIRPTLITIAELYKEIQVKKQTLAIMDEKIDNLNRAQAIHEEERQNIDLLKAAIPKRGEPEGLVRQVEGVVSQNPVSVLALSLGDINLLGEEGASEVSRTTLSPMPEGAGGLTFSVSSSSGYPELAAFVQGMERLRRPFKIDTLLVSAQETAEGKELILVINARSPYLK